MTFRSKVLARTRKRWQTIGPNAKVWAYGVGVSVRLNICTIVVKQRKCRDGSQLWSNKPLNLNEYMLYEKHLARPDVGVFDNVKLHTPNYSGRMDNLRASILRAQLKQLDVNCKRWNDRYQVLTGVLQNARGVMIFNLFPRGIKHRIHHATTKYKIDTAYHKRWGLILNLLPRGINAE